MKFRLTTPLLLSALVATSLAPALAFPYADEDLLMVLRKPGRNDVIYNLGPISQFLEYTGQTPKVITWNKVPAVAAFDTLGDGVQFVLMASTAPLNDQSSRRSWVTDTSLTATRTDLNATGWQGLWSVVSAVGVKNRQRTGASPEPETSLPSNDANSHTFIMSNAGTAATQIPRLGGKITFTAETPIPGTLRLVELKSSPASPRPTAKTWGNFSLNTAGELTYSNATEVPPAAPVVTGYVAEGGTFTVTFTTEAGVKYRLRSSPSGSLSGAISQWTPSEAFITGTGGPGTLATSTLPESGFLVVESYR